jgi:hypothetical protein
VEKINILKKYTRNVTVVALVVSLQNCLEGKKKSYEGKLFCKLTCHYGFNQKVDHPDKHLANYASVQLQMQAVFRAGLHVNIPFFLPTVTKIWFG